MEALRSPFFMGYRKTQPFHANLLYPCPVLDNPGALTKLVAESGAKSTGYQAQEYSDRCVDRAEARANVADALWHCFGHCTQCGKA